MDTRSTKERTCSTSVEPRNARAKKSNTTVQKDKHETKPTGKITPSMAQFLEIKAANPDSILWYRMGDFYELFFEDAKIVSKALSITLTKRGKHLGEDIPMCGVPVVRADEYLHKLIKQGFRVAVCEQLENPADARKRGAKAIVRRDVVRLVTPGTLTEDTLLDAKSGNYLCALCLSPTEKISNTSKSKNKTPRANPENQRAALASIDISTGEFEIGLVALSDLAGELVRLAPRELILSDKKQLDPEILSVLEMLNTALTPVPNAHYDSLSGERQLKELFKITDLGAFGAFDRLELSAVSALLKYIDLTQLGSKPFTRPPRRTSANDVLLIDAASRTSLELTQSASGDKRTSLLASIDRTVTGPGSRELNTRLTSPLRNVKNINARLDAVGFLLDNATLKTDLRKILKSCPDLARAISRLAFQRGSPRDQANIRDALICARDCAIILKQNSGAIGLPPELGKLQTTFLKTPKDLTETLIQALVDEPSTNKRDGGFIKPGYSQELDEAEELKKNGRQIMAELEAKYADLTGIKSLKIRHNNILGYFIEVKQSTADILQQPPHAKTFRHRQSIASAARFTTEELDETQARIATAAERADNIEQEIFAQISKTITQYERVLGAIASALAELDVHAALAHLAQQDNYTRPKIDDSRTFLIKGGRHPVVEQALKAARHAPFIENDCILGAINPLDQTTATDEISPPPGFDENKEHYIWLVTGPNMAGKSTFLRQNALIAILAQIGSYVPARQAHIGVIDRLFSRVGASDDLARGRSTFMVEMVETASILNLATDRSLIILDEIGRGTATFDGLSIAWACVEFLHDITQARTLFATHYHELTVLPERLDGVANVTIDVKEWRDEIIFLHKVKPGAADRSYGIQVAKLAGLPTPVIERASQVLTLLEAQDQAGATATTNQLDELPLFKVAQTPHSQGQAIQRSKINIAIEELTPDELTPREALDILYQLKKLSLDQDQ